MTILYRSNSVTITENDSNKFGSFGDKYLASSKSENFTIHKFYRVELTFREAKATAPGILHHRNASGGNSGNVSDSSSRRYEYNQPYRVTLVVRDFFCLLYS